MDTADQPRGHRSELRQEAEDAMADHHVEIDNLVKTYPGALQALRGSCQLFPATRGNAGSIAQAHRCGKTTILRMIAGLIPVTSGEIRLDGRDISATPSISAIWAWFPGLCPVPAYERFGDIAFGLKCAAPQSPERKEAGGKGARSGQALRSWRKTRLPAFRRSAATRGNRPLARHRTRAAAV